jgi:hypothetical protein
MSVRLNDLRARGAALVGFGAMKDSKNFQENTQLKNLG